MNTNSKYLSSAFLLVATSVLIKIIGAVYKIPLTSFIGAVGRGYFAVAYNLYLPIHAIALGAFPVALSKLVSKYYTTNNTQMLLSLRKSARRVFFFVGIIGMALMLIVAKPYSSLIASSPKSFLTILVLAPSVFFSSLSASYQDYYKGMMDMKPTAVSQALDALFKMIFGLVFARYSMSYLYNEYLQFGTVFGELAVNETQAFSIIYPYTSAFAMLGACLGSFVSLLYSFIYDLINKEKCINYKKLDVKSAQGELLSFAFPIMISCAVQSLFQFLDTASIQFALSLANPKILIEHYYCANVDVSDIVTYTYGLFSTALDFKNLVIGITMSLGVCAVPAISREFELNDKQKLSSLINSIYKYTSLLALLGGTLLSLYACEILNLFYASSQDIVIGCTDLVKFFGASVILYSLSGIAVNAVQAIGCPEKSIKPYVASGIIRVALNLILVKDGMFLLNGAVISSAIGYFVMCVWNLVIVCRSTKISFAFKEVFFKPIIISLFTYIASFYTYKLMDFANNQIINLLIHLSFSLTIFCILCFSLKSLNLQQKILHKNSKKMA